MFILFILLCCIRCKLWASWFNEN